MRLGVLAERNFGLLFLGQATSAFGDRLPPIALAFAVLDLTGSATDLGFVLAAQTLPTLLLVAFAGVWADRLPRQLVMLSSDALRCGSQGTTAALLLLNQARIWELVVLQAVYGAAEAFFTPAMTGLIPATAGPGRLREANALMSLSRSAVGVGGCCSSVRVSSTSSFPRRSSCSGRTSPSNRSAGRAPGPRSPPAYRRAS